MRTIIHAAVLSALLCAPALAQSKDTTNSSAGSQAPAASVDTGKQPETYREAPNAPTTTPGVAGRQPYRNPNVANPLEQGAAQGAEQPNGGRRWGLIVFVVAVVGLALLAFRRRRPMPPSP